MRLIDATILWELFMEEQCEITKYKRYHQLNDEEKGAYDRIDAVLNAIDNAPTIDPEELRPKGRWEMRGGKLYCTHCGKRAAVARDSEDFWYTKGTPACPNCGAKMEVTNENHA